jgi:hypothetical protein
VAFPATALRMMAARLCYSGAIYTDLWIFQRRDGYFSALNYAARVVKN